MAAETCKRCGKVQGDGDKFVFNGHVWRCAECAEGRVIPGSVFPFTTKHLNGQPIEVNSLYHLRKLEAQYGAASAAFNMNECNFGSEGR